MENENIQQMPPQPSAPQFQIQESVPNSTAVLVLGIVSIVTCFCIGIVGLIIGIIALVLASKANDLYKSSPQKYSLSSYNNLKAGRVCAIIGLCLSALYFIYWIIYIVIVGAAVSTMPWQMYH